MLQRWLLGVALVTAVVLATSTPTLAGDAFLKVGLKVHPDVGGFTDSWFVSLGSDWGFNDTGYLGLEIQGAYRSNTAVGPVLVDSVPANLFLNGKWKSEGDTVRPFAGLGFGMMSTYIRSEFNGITTSTYVKDGGFQLMGGIELHRKWVFELLAQRVFLDGAQFHWSFVVGRVW
jgi:hypothetical protein